MGKYKNRAIEEDILTDAESANTSVVNVSDIVKSNNENKFNNITEEIDLEREMLGKINK